ESLQDSSEQIQGWVEKARRKKRSTSPRDEDRSGSSVTIEADKIEIEQAREAGPVHVGHQLWGQLGMNRILQEAGLSDRACTLTEVMTRSEEHTSELQSRFDLVCRLLLEKKKN